jgi:hypothetical protein
MGRTNGGAARRARKAATEERLRVNPVDPVARAALLLDRWREAGGHLLTQRVERLIDSLALDSRRAECVKACASVFTNAKRAVVRKKGSLADVTDSWNQGFGGMLYREMVSVRVVGIIQGKSSGQMKVQIERWAWRTRVENYEMTCLDLEAIIAWFEREIPLLDAKKEAISYLEKEYGARMRMRAVREEGPIAPEARNGACEKEGVWRKL